jgi:hypothetical protein
VARLPAGQLRKLDAEARAFLARQPLPVFIGLYRQLRPRPHVNEEVAIVWQRGAALRGAQRGVLPTLRRAPPQWAAIITDADRLDTSARYIVRLMVAYNRKRRGDATAKRLWEYLLANPPSRDRGARNIGNYASEKAVERAGEWRRWQLEADTIQPGLSVMKVADLVKKRLKLSEHVKTIAKHLTLPSSPAPHK